MVRTAFPCPRQVARFKAAGFQVAHLYLGPERVALDKRQFKSGSGSRVQFPRWKPPRRVARVDSTRARAQRNVGG